ncbi:MAG: GH36-type glycosyl hydrolase domain-containing protein, partial [Oscillospiraceae bacterium]
EEHGYQYFTADFMPDSFDTVREAFIGPYRTETNPVGVERGVLSGSFENGGNQCAGLHKAFTLPAQGSQHACFMLGEGKRENGALLRKKFAAPAARTAALAALAEYWQQKCSALQVNTPNPGMNTMLNIWTLYQSEINVNFSRFASFIEVGGRTGLGYRDTAQDSMTVQHSNPEGCRSRILQLMNGLTREGYGLHLFQPEWFEPKGEGQSFKSPTVVPTPDAASMVHGIEDACSDDALWLVPSVVEYIRETGDFAFAAQTVPYADGGQDTVYDHLKTILNFSTRMVGSHGVCLGLRADWNDCLNLGGGESAMVSFLQVWALGHFIELAARLGNNGDVEAYGKIKQQVTKVCENHLWDGQWYLRGFTKTGRPIGTKADEEGKVHLESNTWAVLSGAASPSRGIACMDAVHSYLATPWGIELNAPAYTKPDDDIGFVTRVYPGLKENASIFSHPNPWAWAAECRLGRGGRAMQYYNALCPYYQNDKIETRRAEPYSYCQFITGRAHTKFGEAHHPFMTGSGGWSYFAATRFMLGIRPEFDSLTVDPCIPPEWDGFTATRRLRGGVYNITVQNPAHVSRGVRQILVNGSEVPAIPLLQKGESCEVQV